MNAHTPGPWQVHEHAPYSVWGIGKSENTQISACRILLDDGTWDRYFPTTSEECRANARLIAAAPELLELVRRYRAATSRTGQAAVLVDKLALDACDADADQLIAKATGTDL